MNDVEKVYQNFWKEIVENPDGTINLEQVKKELYDFHTVLQEVPKVYSALTCGGISKVNTSAHYVIEEVRRIQNEEREADEKEYHEYILNSIKDNAN